MFKRLCVLKIAIGLIVFSGVKKVSCEIKVKIEVIDKDTFIEAEPIWVQTYIKNTGKKKVYLKYKEYIIKNSKGEKAKRDPGVGFGPMKGFPVLPGEELSFYYDILDSYGEVYVSAGHPTIGLRLLPAEEYTIKKHYVILDEKCKVKENIFSNTVKIKVLKPTGKEKEAFELMKEGRMLELQKREFKTALQKYAQFIKLYPNSVYTPKVYETYAYSLILEHKHKEALEKYKDMIRRFPDHLTTCNAICFISMCLEKLGKFHDLEKELEAIIVEYKGKRIAERAEKEILKIKKK